MPHCTICASSQQKKKRKTFSSSRRYGRRRRRYLYSCVCLLLSRRAGFLGQRLRCCGVHLHEFHPECYPIRLPDNDPINGQNNIKCQEYVRSGTAPRVGCTLGPREQINQVTSFIDGSTIYGSSVEEANDLRLFRNGLMKTQPGPAGTSKGLLPADDNIIDCNSKKELR